VIVADKHFQPIVMQHWLAKPISKLKRKFVDIDPEFFDRPANKNMFRFLLCRNIK